MGMSQAMRKRIYPCMAVLLAVTLCLPTNIPPLARSQAYANETSRAAHEPIGTFLQEHAQPESRPLTEADEHPLQSLLTGTADELVETGAYALVKYTLVDKGALWDGFTLDDAFERGDDALLDYVLAQQVYRMPIYQTAPNSHYYICYASPQALCGGDVIVDAVCAHADDTGRTINDASFDFATGIAYLPKHVIDAEGQTQVQLVVAHDPTEGLTRGHVDVRVRNEADVTATFAEATVATPIIDTQIDIPLIPHDEAHAITANNLTIRVNDAPTPLPRSNYSYDPDTGTLHVAGSPLSVASLDVTIGNDTGKAWGAEGDGKGVSGAWQSIPNVELTDFDARTYHAGDRWDYTGQTNYTRIDEQGDLSAAEHQAAKWITQYGYRIKAAGGNEDDEFYDTIKDGRTLDDVDAALYSGYAFGKDGVIGESTGWKYMSFCTSLPVRGWKGNNDSTVPAWAYSMGAQLRERNRSLYWNGETNSYIYPLVTLLCCHASSPFRGAVSTGDVIEGNNYNDDTPIRLRLMAVEKDYIIVGLVTPGFRGPDGGSSLGGGRYQAGAGLYKVRIAPRGRIELQKGSSNTSITSGNACYSLQGAEFEVRDDSGNHATTLVTDERGYARSSDLICGTYTLRETKAPKGYALNEREFRVSVSPNATTRVAGAGGVVADEPTGNPIDLLLRKTDPQTGSHPQGAGSLAGARFTVRYYDGYYDQANLPSTAVRSWTFETDEQGEVHFSDSYLKQGDALYRNAKKQPIVPLGTITIQEVQAPAGYALDDGAGHATPLHVVRITSDNTNATSADFACYAPFDQPDSVQRGDFRLVKKVASEAGIDELATGVQFQIINENDHDVASPEPGNALVKKGDAVCTITVDANGLASTRNETANGWPTPANWAGALAYGTYRIHEVIPSDVQRAFSEAHAGATIATVPDWHITISANRQYDAPALVTDTVPQSPLKVVKIDSETGKPIPLPCSFQLYDQSGCLVTYEAHYPESTTMDTWTTNGSGEATLPMMLHDGTYTLKEIQAPAGYILDPNPVPFTVDSTSRTWDNPLVITITNEPAKGMIALSKSDDVTGTGIAGAQYNICAASDIATPDGTIRAHEGDIVAQLTCGEDGTANSGKLYLGSYRFYETKAPNGYALDPEEHPIELTYEGQAETAMVAPAATTDEATSLRIQKTCSETGKPLAGATFEIASEGADAQPMQLETDESGTACIERLEHGTYRIRETKAPPGWLISEDAAQGTCFTVNDQGFICMDGASEFASQATIAVENEPEPPEAPIPKEPPKPAHASPPTHDDAIRTVCAIVACMITTLAVALVAQRAARGYPKPRQTRLRRK